MTTVKSGRYSILCLLVTGLIAQGCLFAPRESAEKVRLPSWLAGSEGADTETRAARQAERVTARQRGKTLYRHACGTCHGRRGNGRGPSARALDPEPWDLTLGTFMTGEGKSVDLDIFHAVSHGVEGTSMPAWKNLLSQEERWELVEYVRSFSG